ncbi:MAG: hypothetical protein H7Z40_03575 [Phycisphaerae bacterium]|nr:hypothetical protein [Gemmatimonadaceae bacterium]
MGQRQLPARTGFPGEKGLEYAELPGFRRVLPHPQRIAHSQRWCKRSRHSAPSKRLPKKQLPVKEELRRKADEQRKKRFFEKGDINLFPKILL